MAMNALVSLFRRKDDKRQKRWTDSIISKFVIGFAIVLLATLAAFLFVYQQAHELSSRLTFEKLYSQAEYYLQSFGNEVGHVKLLQSDFFNDRKLVFIIDRNMNISDYEKRECLLSVEERIRSIVGVSNLLSDGILYLPKSGYKILPSAVYNMDETDEADMDHYLSYADDRIHYEGDRLFIVKTGVPHIKSTSVPNHVFVLSFSKEQIIKKLALINTSPNSGAFWYNQEQEMLIEHSNCDYIGSKLIPLLSKTPSNLPEAVQRLNVDGQNYMVLAAGYGSLGLFVRYELEAAVMEPVNSFRIVALIVLFLLTLLAVGIDAHFVTTLRKPIKTILNGLKRVQSGNWKEHINEQRRDEFNELYLGFNDMEDQIDRLINEVHVQINLAQRAQLKQLQAQIAPHFLYNSFFLLSRIIKRQDYEKAELLAKHLGAYFQYLNRNEADEVPLSYEVNHALSYAAIQGDRFVNRIKIVFEDLPEKCSSILVPRLIMQPLLENAFKYGLEDKMSGGLLRVHFVESESEWQIWVEDNGEEITYDRIHELSETLAKGKQGEITGLFNIHLRLQQYYNNQSGLRIQSSELGGTAVIIYIGKDVAVYESESFGC